MPFTEALETARDIIHSSSFAYHSRIEIGCYIQTPVLCIDCFSSTKSRIFYLCDQDNLSNVRLVSSDDNIHQPKKEDLKRIVLNSLMLASH
jgi:hypothetical protein